MAYRFTNTEKWNDAWFSELKPLTKLLFLYLCDQCDIAGFIEINIKKIGFDLGIGKQETERCLEGLECRLMFSIDKKYLFIRNFLKHQKNLPLNEKATTYNKIISCLENKLQDFGFQSINDFFQYPTDRVSIGYQYPIGIGIGSSSGKEDGSNIGIGIEKSEKFKNFEDWILRNAKRVATMKEPFTENEYEKLSLEYSPKVIKEILRDMHNWNDLIKKNINANLTFRKWAKKREQ